jgi:hypothetical protein
MLDIFNINDGSANKRVFYPTGVNSFNSADLYSIAYDGSIYLLVGQKSGTSKIWSSTDGITWSFVTSPSITSIYNITYNGTYWVICGSGVSPVQYSVDGVSWNAASGFSGGSQFNQILYNGHTMVISDPYNTSNNI